MSHTTNKILKSFMIARVRSAEFMLDHAILLELLQVVGIYKDLRLDPLQTEAVEFVVNFDPQYATACVEKITCSRDGFV